MEKRIHFGIPIFHGRHGFYLTKENFVVVSNKPSLKIYNSDAKILAKDGSGLYSEKWCKKQLRDCYKNFDLNIEFFSLLDSDEFNGEIEMFLENNQFFEEVYDLNLFDVSGYYVMIIGEYKQLYIGTSSNIKERIRNHWSNRKSFDRMLFPMGNVGKSIIPIDSLRALDTTRILAYKTDNLYSEEDDFINEFSSKFVCNRLAGGIPNGLIDAILMMKERNLAENTKKQGEIHDV